MPLRSFLKAPYAVEVATDVLATALMDQELFTLEEALERVRKVYEGEEEPIARWTRMKYDWD